MNDRLGSLSHVGGVIGGLAVVAVGLVAAASCRGFLALFAGICGVFGLGCVFVSTLINRDIETF